MPGRLHGQAPGIVLIGAEGGSMDLPGNRGSEETRWVNLQSVNPFRVSKILA
jgi:hypothetical protein